MWGQLFLVSGHKHTKAEQTAMPLKISKKPFTKNYKHNQAFVRFNMYSLL